MINNHKLYIIVAADKRLGIGKDGKMPWGLKKELRHFQEITTQTEDPKKENMVLMGRATWESIPKAHRPLPHRKNVVLTRDPGYKAKGAEVRKTLEEAMMAADKKTETIFVIGGGKVYAEVLTLPQLDGIYLTQIDGIFDCDTYFSEIPPRFDRKTLLGKDTEGDIDFEYLLYERQA